MAKHKVSELDGALLDAAVAKAEGLEPTGEPWWPRYSTDWYYAGAIIERERIKLEPREHESGWMAMHPDAPPITGAEGWDVPGPTPLIAAMRAYVSSKFGDEVELP